MDKFILIDDDWQEVILDRKTNKKAFDSIIQQKTSQVNKIILPDYENWNIIIDSKRIILIN